MWEDDVRAELAYVRAKLEIAEKALEPFADIAAGLHPEFPDNRTVVWASPNAAVCRAARAALTAIREGRE